MGDVKVKMTNQNIESYMLDVSVAGGKSTTQHKVTVSRRYYDKLTRGGKISPERLVDHSFNFLLNREPKESILPKFDLSVLKRYYPEYENEMNKRI